MSLYADYKQEREGKSVIETEDYFAVYSISKDTCYIEDIYVRPILRKTGVARQVADWISVIAKERGCKKLIGSVAPSAKGSNDSLLVLLSYGMTLYASHHDIVYLSKDI